ncbi:MAG TPA: Bax inhibitor-1 family protein [Solirubrobacteraceae bacterium]|jgi:modulator of FtsH protease
MSTSSTPGRLLAEPVTGLRDRTDTRAVFGQVMGLVAVTLGFTALGAYIGRDLSGGWGIVAFVVALVCLLGLNAAAARSQSLAMTLLFAFGLLLGLVLGPGLAAYTASDPSAVWQAAGATALFIAALGTFGWATQRDLSGIARTLFWALLALIVFGLVATFVSIPGANVIYGLVGLVIFGGFTAFDFQRLRRAGAESAIPIAAGIFLDVLNVFQLFLLLFGGGGGGRSE